MSNPIGDFVRGVRRLYGIARRDQQTLQERLRHAAREKRRLNKENEDLFNEVERLRKELADCRSGVS
jgi:predicted  nucleic acid-binding Zn-ribbon protein